MAMVGLAVSLAAALGACGRLPGTTKTVEAKAWVADVCGVLRPWDKDVKAALNGPDDRNLNAEQPEDAKALIDDALSKAIKATDNAHEGLEDVGEPDIDQGPEVAKETRSLMTKSAAALRTGRKGVQALKTDDKETFDREATAVLKKMHKDIAAADNGLEQLHAPEVEKLFKNEPSCKNKDD